MKGDFCLIRTTNVETNEVTDCRTISWKCFDWKPIHPMNKYECSPYVTD